MSAATIPKVIHQIVWDGIVPEKFKEYHASLIRHHLHGDFFLRQWNKDSIVRFVEENYQEYVPTFHLLRYPEQVLQLFPYLALYHFGGVYIGLDHSAVQSIEPYIKGAELVLVRKYAKDWMNFVYTWGRYGKRGRKHCSLLLTTGFMASKPKNPFWLAVIENVIRRVYDTSYHVSMEDYVHYVTGAYVLSDTFTEGGWANKQKLILLPSAFTTPCTYAPTWKLLTGTNGPCKWTSPNPPQLTDMNGPVLVDHQVCYTPPLRRR